MISAKFYLPPVEMCCRSLFLLSVFQLFVLRQPIPHLRRVVVGGVYVVIGLALFLAGLEEALFSLVNIMANQLSNPAFIYGPGEVVLAGRLEGLWLVLCFCGHDRVCDLHGRTFSYRCGL